MNPEYLIQKPQKKLSAAQPSILKPDIFNYPYGNVHSISAISSLLGRQNNSFPKMYPSQALEPVNISCYMVKEN